MQRTRRCLIVIALLLCLPRLVLAQQPKQAEEIDAIAELSQRVVMLGETLQLYVRIERALPDPPTIPNIPGLDITYVSSSDQSSVTSIFVNGRLSTQTVERRLFIYNITPQTPGEYTIPSFEIDTITQPGTKPRTRALTLTVREPMKMTDVFVELAGPRTPPLVGQPFEITLRIGFRDGISRDRTSISMPDGMGNFEPVAPGSEIQRTTTRGASVFMGGPVNFTRSFITRGGFEYEIYTARRTVIATQAGQQSLGPVILTLDYAPVGRNIRRFGQRVAVPSDPLTVEVEPLPTSNKPANFSGLIGSYSVRASANQSRAKVGDPISLYVTIEGPDPIERVSPPDISVLPGFDAFRIDDDDIEAAYLDSSRANADGRAQALFTYLIRPATDSIQEVPSIELPYFDVEAREYRTTATEPIPLRMDASRTLTAADGLGSQTDEPENLELKSTTGGLRPNISGEALTRSAPLTLKELIQTPAVIAATTAPPVVLAGAVVFGAVRRSSERSSPAKRRTNGLSSAKSLLRSESNASAETARAAIALALAGISPNAKRTPDSITSSDAREILADHPELAGRVEQLFHDADASVYAPAASTAAESSFLEHALSLIDEIEGATR